MPFIRTQEHGVRVMGCARWCSLPCALDSLNPLQCMPLVKQVQQIMNKADVILYLLDYTKLKTKEEEEMFANLRVLRADLCENFPDRLFLIVNKIDLRNRHGLSPKVRATRHAGSDGLQ